MSEDDDAPLDGLADEVARRRESAESESDVFEGAFDEVGVDVDSEAVWDNLDGAEETPDFEADGEERVVDKRSLCHRCSFFSDPPDVACEREGTSILELVDVDRFRVRNCPVAAERDRLEEMD